jgi:hypothetical protein
MTINRVVRIIAGTFILLSLAQGAALAPDEEERWERYWTAVPFDALN